MLLPLDGVELFNQSYFSALKTDVFFSIFQKKLNTYFNVTNLIVTHVISRFVSTKLVQTDLHDVLDNIEALMVLFHFEIYIYVMKNSRKSGSKKHC
jgi:hypothetical protein